MCVYRDVASEQFAENTTVLSYLQTRLVALNRAELDSLQEAITKRISELLLFTLYVECDGCADIDGLGPMPVQITARLMILQSRWEFTESVVLRHARCVDIFTQSTAM